MNFKKNRNRLLIIAAIIAVLFIVLLLSYTRPPKLDDIYKNNEVEKVLQDEGSIKITTLYDQEFIQSYYYEISNGDINIIITDAENNSYISYSNNLFQIINNSCYYSYKSKFNNNYNEMFYGYNDYLKQITVKNDYKVSGSINEVNIDVQNKKQTLRTQVILGLNKKYKTIQRYTLHNGNKPDTGIVEIKFEYRTKENFPEVIYEYYKSTDYVTVTLINKFANRSETEIFKIPKGRLFCMADEVLTLYQDPNCTQIYSNDSLSPNPVSEDITIYVKRS